MSVGPTIAILLRKWRLPTSE